MIKTDEIKIMEIEDEGKTLKDNFMSSIEEFIKNTKKVKNKDNIYVALRKLHKNAIKYFNHYEEFVGRSDLLNGWKKELWALQFYETCFNVLEAIINYYNLLHEAKISKGIDITSMYPSELAYASMQRVVYNLLPEYSEQTSALENKFNKLNLPTKGFRKMKFKKLNKTETILSVVFGFVFCTTIFVTAIVIPNPSDFQFLIFRMIISLSFAGIGAIIPGFLVIEGKFNGFLIRAGGALALFVLTFFFNPAMLGD